LLLTPLGTFSWCTGGNWGNEEGWDGCERCVKDGNGGAGDKIDDTGFLDNRWDGPISVCSDFMGPELEGVLALCVSC